MVGLVAMALIFAIAYYAAGQKDKCGAVIIIYIITIVGAFILRYVLFGKRVEVSIYIMIILVFAMLSFWFVQFSYEHDIGNNFWFDPHENE